MPDERKESTKEGIGAAPESAVGKREESKRQRELVTNATIPPDSAMGGTSDADSPADEAFVKSIEAEKRR